MRPLTEKYRPDCLTNIIGNIETVRTLVSLSRQDYLPHLLFYGSPGTGKTTAIRALSKRYSKMNVLELNASDERGIGVVRETIKQFAASYSSSPKLVILDEADSMSRDAQNALRRIMEDYSENTRFCLLANFSKNIIPPILSRCTKFRFAPVLGMENRILEICGKENIEITQDGIKALIDICDGDMRKCVNDIQGISAAFDVINMNNVFLFNGLAPAHIYEGIYESLLMDKLEEIKYKIKCMISMYSLDCEFLVRQLAEYVRKSRLRNKMKILKLLSDVEYRRSFGCSNEMQINGCIGIFIVNRN